MIRHTNIITNKTQAYIRNSILKRLSYCQKYYQNFRWNISNIKVIKGLVNRGKDQAGREIKFRKILGSNMPIPPPTSPLPYYMTRLIPLNKTRKVSASKNVSLGSIGYSSAHNFVEKIKNK
ncbi:uncharacterized protein METZ01_LOCUS78835, partial [marine metagenome]